MQTINMNQRCQRHDYNLPGIYHITMKVADDLGQPLGHVAGDPSKQEGEPDAPHVVLTAAGEIVEQELLNSIHAHYPMMEIQDYVIMPEHIHFIIEAHSPIRTKSGKESTLGQVIAGFKKGCNRRFWELSGQNGAHQEGAEQREAGGHQGKPDGTNSNEAFGKEEPSSGKEEPSGGKEAFGKEAPSGKEAGSHQGKPDGTNSNEAFGKEKPSGGKEEPSGGKEEPSSGKEAFGKEEPSGKEAGRVGCPAVSPPASVASAQRWKVPSKASSGRPPLFSRGFTDVIPLRKGQLAQQRAYIRSNPRTRLLRESHPDWLYARRGGIPTALTPPALRAFLHRECGAALATPEALEAISAQLLIAADGTIDCDSFGNRALLARHLLPVVCHRKDKARFPMHKARCLEEAARGTVLVSGRISSGEHEIMDEALSRGFPTILIADNGFGERYHPSSTRLEQCARGQLLIVTPWQYRYRPKTETLNVPQCKTLNCLAQALAHLKDSWWK